MSHYGGIWDVEMNFQMICTRCIFLWDLTKSSPNYQSCLESPTWKGFWEERCWSEMEVVGVWTRTEVWIKRERLIALGIFGLVLFPSQIGIISLEATTAYVEYENTQINPVASILAETIITLNHCWRAEKGEIRYCTQLLYIWMVSHIETKKPVFNNFWWFDQKPLRIVEEEK